MAKPVTIGEITYRTQTACMEDVRRRIAAIGITPSIRETSPAEYEFFHELVKRHAAHEEKLKDLSDIAIRHDAIKKNAFAIDIVNTNGTRTEISWDKCVTGKSEPQRSKFHSALRYAVEDQIAAFREQSKVETCELCTESLSLMERGVGKCSVPTHVDHILHFETLADNFTARQEITMPTTYEKEPVTYLTRFKEEDRDIGQQFAEYHREHAALRLICEPCNLKREKAIKRRI